MKVRFMQIVDFWLGVPLCFMLSLWHGFYTFFFKPAVKKPQKILFIELSEMGSAILAYSSLIKAKREFEGSQIFFLIFKRNRESVDLLEVMPRENCLTIREDNFVLFTLTLCLALFKIYRMGLDTVIDMELFSRATQLISYLSGAANRVGFHNYTAEGLYRGNLLTHPVLYNPHQHMSLNFLSLVQALKESTTELPLVKKDVRGDMLALPQKEPPAPEATTMRQALSAQNPKLAGTNALVLLNPDPGLLPLRGWGVENFAELARRVIQARPEAVVVIVGLSRSQEFATAIGERLPEQNFIDFTGKTKTLSELLVLFSLAKLLVTNDSGPAHMASLTGLPTLVLFGPETPGLYAPLGDKVAALFAGLACSPCLAASNHRRTICTNNRCLQAIKVEDVLAAVLKRL